MTSGGTFAKGIQNDLFSTKKKTYKPVRANTGITVLLGEWNAKMPTIVAIPKLAAMPKTGSRKLVRS